MSWLTTVMHRNFLSQLYSHKTIWKESKLKHGHSIFHSSFPLQLEMGVVNPLFNSDQYAIFSFFSQYSLNYSNISDRDQCTCFKR